MKVSHSNKHDLRVVLYFAEADNNCNSIFGCYGSTTAGDRGLERCSCYRDCHRSGPKVCGSDGRLHHNLCRLEVEACRGGKHVYVVPMHICNRGKIITSFCSFLIVVRLNTKHKI